LFYFFFRTGRNKMNDCWIFLNAQFWVLPLKWQCTLMWSTLLFYSVCYTRRFYFSRECCHSMGYQTYLCTSKYFSWVNELPIFCFLLKRRRWSFCTLIERIECRSCRC
jgi:hypothetical protein